MRISSDNTIYTFSPKNKPIARIKTGTEITMETKDCFSNQLRDPGNTVDALDWDSTNPTTGPIFIEDAKVGDILKVEIKKIQLNEKGTITGGGSWGPLGHLHLDQLTEIIQVENGMAKFLNNINIPVKPMIGVIGVAPASGAINNGTPGNHGGNMDNKMVCEGATLYFNVEVEGALFALGDFHAVMGDGEIGGTGLEIPAEVTVIFDIIKNKKSNSPSLKIAKYGQSL